MVGNKIDPINVFDAENFFRYKVLTHRGPRSFGKQISIIYIPL